MAAEVCADRLEDLASYRPAHRYLASSYSP